MAPRRRRAHPYLFWTTIALMMAAVGLSSPVISVFEVRQAHGLLLTLVVVLAWLLVIAIAVMARLCVSRYDPPAGSCSSCRYDLTGNITGVCPECGATTTKRTQA